MFFADSKGDVKSLGQEDRAHEIEYSLKPW
jgi:hypothetical protein